MLDEGLDMRLGIENGRAMGRHIDRVVPVEQLLERTHIRPHFSVGWNDNAGRPAHHVVAGEQNALFGKRKTEMVGGMARSMYCANPPPVSFQHVAIPQRLV